MNGAFTLAVNTTGATTFAGAVGRRGERDDQRGGSTSLGGNVTTTGAQTFNDAVSLTEATSYGWGAPSPELRGRTVLQPGGEHLRDHDLRGRLGPTGMSLRQRPGYDELGGNVSTRGTQTYNDAVSLTAA